jgi:hypothetical protein
LRKTEPSAVANNQLELMTISKFSSYRSDRGNLDMGQKKKIVIAEDQTLVRQGLRSLLSSEPELKVVAEAENGLEAIRCASK